MKRILSVLLFISMLALAACGGSSDNEPTTDTTDSNSSDTTAETSPEEVDTTVTEAAETEDEEAAEESTETEEVNVEEAAEEVVEETAEEGQIGFGDLPMSGIDPDTGFEINPTSVRAGDTYIVRGIIISMNLTPITSPEFLIESPDKIKFRIRSQSLNDTYFMDGTQWKPFEFKLGVGAQATVTLDASARLSDVAVSDDLTLVMLNE
jgi:hypothetical protein